MQIILDWITNNILNIVSSSTIILGVIYFLKDTFVRYIQNSLDARFSARLKKLESELRRSEDAIAVARNHVLGKIALESEASVQVEAVKAIWICHCEAQNLAFCIDLLKVLKEDAISDAVADQRVRNFTDTILSEINQTEFKILNKNISGIYHKPFVSGRIFDLHTAYNSIVNHGYATFSFWKAGMDPRKLLDSTKVCDLVARVMPSRSDYIKKHQMQAVYYLLDEIDAELVSQMRNLLWGEDTDLDAARRASAALQVTRLAAANPKIFEAAQKLDDRFTNPVPPRT